MKFRVEITHPQLGEFIGETMSGDAEDYVALRDAIKGAFVGEFYELYLDNGAFLSIPRKVMQDCILKLQVIEDVNEEED